MFRTVAECPATKVAEPIADTVAVRAAPLALADVLALMLAKEKMSAPVPVAVNDSPSAPPVWAFDDYAGLGRVVTTGRPLAEWLTAIFGETPVTLVPDAKPNSRPPPTVILLPRTARSLARIGMGVADALGWWIGRHPDGPEIFAARTAEAAQQAARAAWEHFESRVTDAVAVWHRELSAHGLTDPQGAIRGWHDGENTVRAVEQTLTQAAEREAKILQAHAAKVRAQLQPNGADQIAGLSADFLADLVGGPAALVRGLAPHIDPPDEVPRVLALD